MNRPSLVLALAASLLATAAQADRPIAGYDRLTVEASHRPTPLAASIWYPVGTPTYRGRIGDNAVFEGTDAMVGAAVAAGSHPLVVLSHGSGGNMDALGWLGSGLALRGAMVLAVNHPGSTSGDSSPRRSVHFTERARDLSAALDQLLAEPAFAPHVDPKRITAMGFSLGGATALNLAGLRFDRAAYPAYCARLGDEAPDCVFLAKGGVDLAALPEAFEGAAADPRIAAVIAVDPAFTYAAESSSVAALAAIPALFVGLGDPPWPTVDVGPKGSDLLARLPRATLALVAPAHHFTFLALCKPGAEALLAAEGEDAICDDPPGVDRAIVHQRIVDRVAAFLGL